MGCSLSCHLKSRLSGGKRLKMPGGRTVTSSNGGTDDAHTDGENGVFDSKGTKTPLRVDSSTVNDGEIGLKIEASNELTKEMHNSINNELESAHTDDELVLENTEPQSKYKCDVMNGDACEVKEGQRCGIIKNDNNDSPCSGAQSNTITFEDKGNENCQCPENKVQNTTNNETKQVCPFKGAMSSESESVMIESNRLSPIKHADSSGDLDVHRKVSQNSNVSNVSSQGSDEVEPGERKLDLRGLIESVGTLVLPTVRLIISISVFCVLLLTRLLLLVGRFGTHKLV